MCVYVCGQPHKHAQAAKQADEHFLMYLASKNANYRQKVRGKQVKCLSQRRLWKKGILFPQLWINCSPLHGWEKYFSGDFFLFVWFYKVLLKILSSRKQIAGSQTQQNTTRKHKAAVVRGQLLLMLGFTTRESVGSSIQIRIVSYAKGLIKY